VPTPWQSLNGSRAAMITTFKRDGTGVPTPVGFGVAGEELYFMTNEQSWKVKRLSRNPRVAVAASTLRGMVTGPTLKGLARPLAGAEADAARTKITEHNRLAWFLLLRRARRKGTTWQAYAVLPVAD
jgi:PPOX class probable F420-dependent enzyme